MTPFKEIRKYELMESVEHILTSPYTAYVIIGIVAIATVILILALTGNIRIKTKDDRIAVSIGGADKEREIIRHQVEWDKPPNYNEWLGKYISERVYDEYINMITFNHISTADTYIEVKQDLILDVIRKYTISDFFKSKKFETLIRDDTRECITTLVQIRELYK